MESRSTGSDAKVIHTVILMRLKNPHSRKPSFYSNYNSKVLPLSLDADEPCVINIIHDNGGAKAPLLIYEGTTTGP